MLKPWHPCRLCTLFSCENLRCRRLMGGRAPPTVVWQRRCVCRAAYGGATQAGWGEVRSIDAGSAGHPSRQTAKLRARKQICLVRGMRGLERRFRPSSSFFFFHVAPEQTAVVVNAACLLSPPTPPQCHLRLAPQHLSDTGVFSVRLHVQRRCNSGRAG